MDLAGARTVVTGAGGFIGGACCGRLVAEGAEVVGLDADAAAAGRVESLGATFAECDVTDPSATAAALEGARFVVHTAAIVSDWGAMEDYVRVNVGGTRNVLDAAGQAERVVHVSSVAIWGYEFRQDVHEDHPPRHTGVPYIDTKAASDRIALARSATVVRPGDVYGPRSVPWARRPLEALRSRVFGVPDGIMTPVYVDDLVDCIVRALTHPDAGGQAFVAWEGPPVSTKEFFDHFTHMAGRDAVPVAPRLLLSAAAAAEETVARVTGRAPRVTRWGIGYLARTAAYRATRAQEMLGWHPQVSLDEGMRRTEEWARGEGLLG